MCLARFNGPSYKQEARHFGTTSFLTSLPAQSNAIANCPQQLPKQQSAVVANSLHYLSQCNNRNIGRTYIHTVIKHVTTDASAETPSFSRD